MMMFWQISAIRKILSLLMPSRQQNIQLAAADESAGEAGEDQPERGAIEMIGAEENDRRAGHVDKQAGKRESAGDRVDVETAAAR